MEPEARAYFAQFADPPACLVQLADFLARHRVTRVISAHPYYEVEFRRVVECYAAEATIREYDLLEMSSVDGDTMHIVTLGYGQIVEIERARAMEYEYEFAAYGENVKVSVPPSCTFIDVEFGIYEMRLTIDEAKLLHNCLKFAIDAAKANE